MSIHPSLRQGLPGQPDWQGKGRSSNPPPPPNTVVYVDTVEQLFMCEDTELTTDDESQCCAPCLNSSGGLTAAEFHSPHACCSHDHAETIFMMDSPEGPPTTLGQEVNTQQSAAALTPTVQQPTSTPHPPTVPMAPELFTR